MKTIEPVKEEKVEELKSQSIKSKVTAGIVAAILVFLLGLFVGTKIPTAPIVVGPVLPDTTFPPSQVPYDPITEAPKPETTYIMINGYYGIPAPPETLYNWWRGGIITEVYKESDVLKLSILRRDGFYLKKFIGVGNTFHLYWEDSARDWVQKSTYSPPREKQFTIRTLLSATSLPDFSGEVDFVYKKTYLIGAGVVYGKEYNVDGYEYRIRKYGRFGVQFELSF